MQNNKHSPRSLVPSCRLAVPGALLVLLAACGGGGGSVSSGSVVASATSVTVAATYLDVAPTGSFSVEAVDMPADGLYLDIDYGTRGVQLVDFTETVPGRADFTVSFRPPLDVDVGTVSDTITLRICEDDRCARQVSGSPIRVTATYTVTSPTSATISTTTLSALGSTATPTSITLNATLNFIGIGATPPTVAPIYPSALVQSVSSGSVSGGEIAMTVDLVPPSWLMAGTHTDNMTIRVCYDSQCRREVNGSPFTIALSYIVTNDPLPEPGLDPVPVAGRIVLPHDVVDAEYSKALNAVVMVSSWPRNALYVYDVATGVGREAALSKPPTAVSVAPDGLSAAVGHDALITCLQLLTVGEPTAPAPVVLNVSTRVLDIVLDGRGSVHALPAADQWESVHSVDIATNTETLDSHGFLYAGTLGRLHPSGDYLYTADNGLTPSDIQKYDIRTGAATRLYDSPYHGDFSMCGNVWMKEDGTTLYTRCGNTFRSSTIPAQDMVYTGRLSLSQNQYHYQIASLSQSDATQEILLVEEDPYACRSYGNPLNCYMHVAIYESEFQNRLALYSIPPLTVSGTAYVQRGLFVFHSADGTGRFMVSRLHGMPNAATEYYLTTLQ